jgi:Leucine-rich repeat (LRR) protein
MADVQEWLDGKYPKEIRSSITDLDISRQGLEGNLKLEGFSKLEILTCHSNKLTGLNLSEAIQLEEIDCSNNLLTDVIFSLQGPKNLTRIYLNNNNFPLQGLNRFRNFVNLEHLAIGNDNEKKIKQGIYNRFYGSLKPLKSLTNLECLDIEGTDVDSGLEYLPIQNLKEFCCAAIRKKAKVENIKNTLDLSEEEAKSAEKEISKYKINKVRNFQLRCL